MAIFRFDADTAGSILATATTTATQGSISDQFEITVAVELAAQWNIDGRILNGGYVQAVIVRAVQTALAAGEASGDPGRPAIVSAPESPLSPLIPVAVSTSFVAQARPGGATVAVTLLRSGQAITAARAELRQGDAVVAATLVTLTRPSGGAFEPPTKEQHGAARASSSPAMPLVTSAADSIRLSTHQLPGPPGLAEVVDYAFVPEASRWLAGDTSAGPRIQCWMQFADGRPLDNLAALALVDMAPPVCFALGHFGWAPTLQLQVALFGSAVRGPVLLDLVGSPYDGPVVVEDGMLWDSDGTLIARSRQVALAPRA